MPMVVLYAIDGCVGAALGRTAWEGWMASSSSAAAAGGGVRHLSTPSGRGRGPAHTNN